MYNLLTNRNDPVTIGDTEVEVTIEENHDYTNTVTKYPVEEGFDISDHIHQEPEAITVSGVFSDTPLPLRDGKLSPFIIGAGELNTQKALEELLAIAGRVLPKQEKVTGIIERQIDPTNTVVVPEKVAEPQVVDIVSGLRIYTNMICISLKFRRDRTTGQSLPFTMTFQKLYTVASEVVAIDKTDDLNGKAPNIKNQGPETKAAGTQTTKEPTSVFAQIYDGLKTIWGGE